MNAAQAALKQSMEEALNLEKEVSKLQIELHDSHVQVAELWRKVNALRCCGWYERGCGRRGDAAQCGERRRRRRAALRAEHTALALLPWHGGDTERRAGASRHGAGHAGARDVL